MARRYFRLSIRHSSDSQVMYAWNKTGFPLSVYFGIYISKHIVCVGIQEISGVVQKQNRIQTEGIIYGFGRKFIL